MVARALAAVLALALVATAACGDDETTADRPPVGAGPVDVPDGFDVTEVADGLSGPTQVVAEDGGTLLVAQLNGPEDGGEGQVVRLDPASGAEPLVLFDGLDTPTGVAVWEDEIWVMERRRLSHGPLSGGSLEVELDDLPFNGRSEGTLTTTPDGDLLYLTSGAVEEREVVPGSGALWSLAPGGQPEVVAGGLKNAYAHTFDADGTLWATEVAEGTDGTDLIPDEVVRVEEGQDQGWPACVGDRTPDARFGGTEDVCADAPPSQALFEAGATPTSLVVAPWDPDLLVVALWGEGRVVTLPRGGEGPVEVTTFLEGLTRPQHLVVVDDRLLVADHESGRIVSVGRAG